MRDLRVREVPVDLCEAPLFLSYPDSEGEGAGIGVALWCPDGSSIGGYIALPEVVRSVWSRSAVGGDHYDIFEIEANGPALAVHSFGQYITPGSLWLRFIDNEAALATLIKGSSSVMSGEVITAYTHSRATSSGIWA